mgnify:CR=1 FL=1
MPLLLLIFFIGTIVYFFLPHHILSRSGSRITWLIRGFILLNGLAFWVGSDAWLSTRLNPVWQLTIRFFLLELGYVLALGALYAAKGWRLPSIVAVAVFVFYSIWIMASLIMVQTTLPPFVNVDAPLNFKLPVFIILRITAALSTIVLFVELTRCFYRIWTGDQLLTGRLRFGLFGLGTTFALLNRLFVLAHIAMLLSAPREVSDSVLALEKTINLVATVFFLGGCLPPFVMARLARGIVYLDQQRAILELAMLRAVLIHTTAPLPWPLPDWRTRLKEPTYVLYSSMIDVLDRLWLLESLPSSKNPTLSDIKSIRDPLASSELLERLRDMARRVWFKRLTARLHRILTPVRIW